MVSSLILSIALLRVVYRRRATHRRRSVRPFSKSKQCLQILWLDHIDNMFMDGSDLYDDDVPSTTAAKAERWTNMSTSERNEERMQRKKERKSKKKSKKSNDDTVVEDFEYNWDDDEEDENETAGQYQGNNNGLGATGPEEDDGVFDDPEFMKTAVKEHARYLGMDPSDKDHAELMWIAEEALTAPLPDDWEQGVTDDGTPYFYNVKTKGKRVGSSTRRTLSKNV